MKKLYILGLTMAATALTAQAQFSIQKVVMEEFTGAWCQYCADGSYRAQQVEANYPDAMVVAIHDGDAMEVTIGADMASFYSPAYPQALINRSGALVSRGSWNSTVGTALQGAAAVTVSFDSVSYNATTREFVADVKAMFTGPETGDLRLNLMVVEDHLTGSGSGWNQVNADNGTPGHPYFQAGNPIIGFDHRHVMRTMLDGAWGVPGVIPSSVNFGTTATRRYTFTLPAGWKAWDVSLVAVVQKYGLGVNDREIINGEEFHLNNLVVGTIDQLDHSKPYMTVSPNPVTSMSKITYTLQAAGQVRLEVLNTLGQHVATLGEGIMNEGVHTINWDGRTGNGSPAENGIYIVRLVTENGQSCMTKVMLAR